MIKKNKQALIKEALAGNLSLSYPVPELTKVCSAAPPKKIRKTHEGHRQRLRERFRQYNGEGFADYELLELLLFRSILRADTKPLAKTLLAQFGSLAAILGTDIELLKKVPGCGEALALDLKIIQKICERVLTTNFEKRDIFSSWDKVILYLKVAMAQETKEQFRVLFLDKKNGLLKDEVQQVGTIDRAPVYPRELIRRALELGAASIILVHNHPSGDPTPSEEDIALTQKLKEIAQQFNIMLHDHIIIGRSGYSSFRVMQLL